MEKARSESSYRAYNLAALSLTIVSFGVSMLGAVVPAAQVWITKIVIDNVISAVGNADGAAVDWTAARVACTSP